LVSKVSESCLSLLPRGAGKHARKSGFWQTKAYKSKTKINFTNFFGIPKEETFMEII
jgi:hypothetical protein